MSVSAIVTNVPVVSWGTSDIDRLLQTLRASSVGIVPEEPFALQHCRNASASPKMFDNLKKITPMPGTWMPSRMLLAASISILRRRTLKHCDHCPRIVFIVLAFKTATGIHKHSCFSSDPSSRIATYTAINLRVVSNLSALPGTVSSKYTTWLGSMLPSPGGFKPGVSY